MLNLSTVTSPKLYSEVKNARFSSTESNIRSLQERWDETYNSLHPYQQEVVSQALSSAVAEFRRRNPKTKSWNQLMLAEAKSAPMSTIKIDGTMQRKLDIFWVLNLLNNFMATMVLPIQVYKPDPNKEEFLAWDGQHTIMLLWIIAKKIFGENPDNIIVPVNLFHSNLKSEMRSNFISLNSKEGKKQLEMIDIFEQQVFGVRVDNSTNPIWQEAEKKQQHIEKFGLFVTAKKFGDDDQPGAITRLQEVNKLPSPIVSWLCEYLSHSTQLSRPVAEKEMVMMAHYFDRCRLAHITVDSEYISSLANTLRALFNCDFSPNSDFWDKASTAYHNWHSINSVGFSTGRFNKEPVHGFPFLIAQLQKSFDRPVPRSDSKSGFWPADEDLF